MPGDWPRIKQIVADALEREPAERRAFVELACADSEEVRAEVESLLAAHGDAPSANLWGTTLDNSAIQPHQIGPYLLIQVLGTGGMGQVWLAEQTEPVRRRVALKLIKAGMYDDS